MTILSGNQKNTGGTLTKYVAAISRLKSFFWSGLSDLVPKMNILIFICWKIPLRNVSSVVFISIMILEQDVSEASEK